MEYISVPKSMEAEIEAIIRAGYFKDKSEIVRESLSEFLARKANLRIAAAIELYKDKKITISRAAELAGVSFENMKNILAEEGILKRGAKSVKEMRERSKELKKKI
jgi:predicted HTH domain antitoxin